MTSYRVLNSVGHNWAHSLLSDGNFVGDTIFVQLLLEMARNSSEHIITIDPIKGSITPDENITPEITKLVNNLPEHFESALKSQGCSREMVESVQLHIDFDIEHPNPKYNEVNSSVWYSEEYRMPEASKYKAVVILTDSRGREYKSELKEFWRF
jgi:hypothetical protein